MNPIEVWTDIVITALAAATFFMAWKTKTLTDVVSEMKKETVALTAQNLELSNQTGVLTKSYEHKISSLSRIEFHISNWTLLQESE